MKPYAAWAFAFMGLMALAGLLGYRQGYVQADARHSLAAADQVLQQHAAARQIEQTRSALDTQHIARLRKLEDDNATLRTRLERGGIRMHVRAARCEPTGPDAAGLDDGAGRADLHAATAADLAGLAGDADALAVQLTALQAWVAASRANP